MCVSFRVVVSYRVSFLCFCLLKLIEVLGISKSYYLITILVNKLIMFCLEKVINNDDQQKGFSRVHKENSVLLR